MTCSFHKYGDFFPGTGDIKDIGTDGGKYYSVNVPLDEGMDDSTFQYVFRPVIQKIMERFDPGAVVLQCGADSLTGDRLGVFNLTLNNSLSLSSFSLSNFLVTKIFFIILILLIYKVSVLPLTNR